MHRRTPCWSKSSDFVGIYCEISSLSIALAEPLTDRDDLGCCETHTPISEGKYASYERAACAGSRAVGGRRGHGPTNCVCLDPAAQVVAVDATTKAAAVIYSGSGSFSDCVLGPDGRLYVANDNEVLRFDPQIPLAPTKPCPRLPAPRAV